MKQLQASLYSRVLIELSSHDGVMAFNNLCRRLGINQSALDPILKDLEQEGRIIRTLTSHGKYGSERQLISLRV